MARTDMTDSTINPFSDKVIVDGQGLQWLTNYYQNVKWENIVGSRKPTEIRSIERDLLQYELKNYVTI